MHSSIPGIDAAEDHLGTFGGSVTTPAPDCVFCALLAGSGTAQWVAREQQAAAFLSLPSSALAPGHTLVIPTEHALGIQEARGLSLLATVSLAQKVARAMRDVLGASGVNILNASGPGSEQSVPHLHMHVVPRWEGDGFSTWPTGRSTHAPVANVAAVLAASIDPWDPPQ
jgi:histidine triad (HIT) family protein